MKNQPFHRKVRNAWTGVMAAWAGERNFRIQVAAAVAVVALFAWIRVALIWWALTTLCVGLVLGAEMLNSAIEALADHLHPERHPGIGRVKDMLAGMVLILSIAAAIVGGIAVYATLAG